ncbi:hypothetical protein OKW42_008049 [Paraburkholderia sp. WC7.3d]
MDPVDDLRDGTGFPERARGVSPWKTGSPVMRERKPPHEAGTEGRRSFSVGGRATGAPARMTAQRRIAVAARVGAFGGAVGRCRIVA